MASISKNDIKDLLADEKVQRAQKLRLTRFGMAVITYGVVILADVLVVRLDLGGMGPGYWMAFIGSALAGNAVFFTLFRTGLNLRFPEPSLTREQIIFSGLWGMLALHALPAARPIVLMFYVPAFSFGILALTRRQYVTVVSWVMSFYGLLLVFEYFQKGAHFKLKYELFLFVLFGILLIWFAFFGGFVSQIRRRLSRSHEEIKQAHAKIEIEVKQRRQTQEANEKLIAELQASLNKVKTLSGLLPICASCKKIRDDKGYWNQIESYIHAHSEAEFSHSLCPECLQRLYPDI